MAEGYDRFDNEGAGGGSFVMGLLTGTVLGAGLGMLFAPKAGSELRNQISEQAGNLANTASAYVVITSPPLRRLATIASRRWLGASVPLYVMNEVRRAWAGSRQIRPATLPAAAAALAPHAGGRFESRTTT